MNDEGTMEKPMEANGGWRKKWLEKRDKQADRRRTSKEGRRKMNGKQYGWAI